MFSTGNDIVAFDLVSRTKSRDSRYYRKILLASEAYLYTKSLGPRLAFEQYLWLCWAVKESVFKYFSRNSRALRFNPSKIEITGISIPDLFQLTAFPGIEWKAGNDLLITGSILCPLGRLSFRSVMFNELVAVEVSDDSIFPDSVFVIRKIGTSASEEQSRAVRSYLLEELQSLFPGQRLALRKTLDGIPSLTIGDRSVPVSFSHHGQYVSYACRLSGELLAVAG